MELTYENMMEFVKNYYDILPTLNGDAESERRLGEFLASDCVVRRSGGIGGEVIMENREQRLKHLNGHADKYRAVCLYEPYPLFITVDDRKKIVTTLIKELFKHPVTGEVYHQLAIVATFELVLDENKNIKIKRETVTVMGGALDWV